MIDLYFKYSSIEVFFFHQVISHKKVATAQSFFVTSSFLYPKKLVTKAKLFRVIGELKMLLQNSLWDVLAFSWVWKFVIMEENFKVS